MTLASNIALDDLNFSTNLTCVSAGELAPQETFQGKVFFTGDYPYTCTFVLVTLSIIDAILIIKTKAGVVQNNPGLGRIFILVL